VDVGMRQLMYEPKHKLLFCRNAKVGTTSWLTNFLLLSPQRDLYRGGDRDQAVQPLPARLPHVRVQSRQVPQLGQTIDNAQWKRSLEFEETNCTCNLDTFWKDDNIW